MTEPRTTTTTIHHQRPDGRTCHAAVTYQNHPAPATLLQVLVGSLRKAGDDLDGGTFWADTTPARTVEDE